MDDIFSIIKVLAIFCATIAAIVAMIEREQTIAAAIAIIFLSIVGVTWFSLERPDMALAILKWMLKFGFVSVVIIIILVILCYLIAIIFRAIMLKIRLNKIINLVTDENMSEESKHAAINDCMYFFDKNTKLTENLIKSLKPFMKNDILFTMIIFIVSNDSKPYGVRKMCLEIVMDNYSSLLNHISILKRLFEKTSDENDKIVFDILNHIYKASEINLEVVRFFTRYIGMGDFTERCGVHFCRSTFETFEKMGLAGRDAISMGLAETKRQFLECVGYGKIFVAPDGTAFTKDFGLVEPKK